MTHIKISTKSKILINLAFKFFSYYAYLLLREIIWGMPYFEIIRSKQKRSLYDHSDWKYIVFLHIIRVIHHMARNFFDFYQPGEFFKNLSFIKL